MAIIALSIAAAGLLYDALNRFGGRTARSWALPVSGAILYGGIGYALHLPDWVVIAGFLATPLVFHKNFKAQLRASARVCARVPLRDGKTELVAVTGSSGHLLGQWDMEPEGFMRLGLEFKGEEDEDYRVILSAQAVRAPQGVLSCHRPGSRLGPDPVLKDRESLDGLPGLSPGIVVRALPADYGFSLLDVHVLSAVGEILELSNKTRDIHIHLSGPKLAVESNEIFDADELEILLGAAGTVFKKVHDSAQDE